MRTIIGQEVTAVLRGYLSIKTLEALLERIMVWSYGNSFF